MPLQRVSAFMRFVNVFGRYARNRAAMLTSGAASAAPLVSNMQCDAMRAQK
jgi:hypothetical protein